MKDVNVTQVLFAQQVTRRISFSEKGAGETERETAHAHSSGAAVTEGSTKIFSDPLATLCKQHADIVSHGSCEIFIHHLYKKDIFKHYFSLNILLLQVLHNSTIIPCEA